MQQFHFVPSCHARLRDGLLVVIMGALIGCAAIALLYLGKRLGDSKHENADLRTQIASLKRQLRGR